MKLIFFGHDRKTRVTLYYHPSDKQLYIAPLLDVKEVNRYSLAYATSLLFSFLFLSKMPFSPGLTATLCFFFGMLTGGTMRYFMYNRQNKEIKTQPQKYLYKIDSKSELNEIVKKGKKNMYMTITLVLVLILVALFFTYSISLGYKLLVFISIAYILWQIITYILLQSNILKRLRIYRKVDKIA